MRPALSRAAIASVGSPTLGSATLTGWANPGVAGRFRAIGSLPGKLAQPLTIRLSEIAAISDRPLGKFLFQLALEFIVLLPVFDLFGLVALVFRGEQFADSYVSFLDLDLALLGGRDALAVRRVVSLLADADQKSAGDNGDDQI